MRGKGDGGVWAWCSVGWGTQEGEQVSVGGASVTSHVLLFRRQSGFKGEELGRESTMAVTDLGVISTKMIFEP